MKIPSAFNSPFTYFALSLQQANLLSQFRIPMWLKLASIPPYQQSKLQPPQANTCLLAPQR